MWCHAVNIDSFFVYETTVGEQAGFSRNKMKTLARSSILYSILFAENAKNEL